MKISINEINGQTIIAIDGRLNTSTARIFEESIHPILQDSTPDIIIDCTELQYISSSGLRLFVILLKHTKSAGGSMEVRNLSPEVKDVFDMTGFSNLFNI